MNEVLSQLETLPPVARQLVLMFVGAFLTVSVLRVGLALLMAAARHADAPEEEYYDRLLGVWTTERPETLKESIARLERECEIGEEFR